MSIFESAGPPAAPASPSSAGGRDLRGGEARHLEVAGIPIRPPPLVVPASAGDQPVGAAPATGGFVVPPADGTRTSSAVSQRKRRRRPPPASAARAAMTTAAAWGRRRLGRRTDGPQPRTGSTAAPAPGPPRARRRLRRHRHVVPRRGGVGVDVVGSNGARRSPTGRPPVAPWLSVHGPVIGVTPGPAVPVSRVDSVSTGVFGSGLASSAWVAPDQHVHRLAR